MVQQYPSNSPGSQMIIFVPILAFSPCSGVWQSSWLAAVDNICPYPCLQYCDTVYDGSSEEKCARRANLRNISSASLQTRQQNRCGRKHLRDRFNPKLQTALHMNKDTPNAGKVLVRTRAPCTEREQAWHRCRRDCGHRHPQHNAGAKRTVQCAAQRPRTSPFNPFHLQYCGMIDGVVCDVISERQSSWSKAFRVAA
jgi:hypothetical protein